LALQWSEIDLAEGTLNVFHTLRRIDGQAPADAHEIGRESPRRAFATNRCKSPQGTRAPPGGGTGLGRRAVAGNRLCLYFEQREAAARARRPTRRPGPAQGHETGDLRHACIFATRAGRSGHYHCGDCGPQRWVPDEEIVHSPNAGSTPCGTGKGRRFSAGSPSRSPGDRESVRTEA
jgi:hypothetical protein